ncbi:hypothetical protein SteCoe_36817 [Stentor coeruleus]|uniref:Protein kinase domain-containing protein n=1 Tax=Stentor coeruleus TaxID=5963 RepID=A0A1R2AP89_9CILI|nr:hypothetical protein SteCoe_36817 [Stentor coeruleus]
MRYAEEILKYNDGGKIVKILEFLIEIKNCGFEMDNAIMIIVRGAISFLEYRNKILPYDIEAAVNIQEDYKILKLVIKLGVTEETLTTRIQTIRAKLEETEQEREEIKVQESPSPSPNQKPNPAQAPAVEKAELPPKFDYSTIQIRNIESGITYKSNIAQFARTHENFQVAVYQAEYMGAAVAVKIYTKLKPEADLTRVYNECRFYQMLGDKADPVHNAFLKYYGTYTQGKCVCLVMEYVESDVMNFLTAFKQQNQKITDIQLLPIFHKLIVSFAEMEELGIYHGDIKPHNMLVDNNWNIKIIDYSISVVSHESLTGGTTSGLHPLQGTAGYMAPEIIDGIKKGDNKAYFKMSRADVFSLGISFLQMLTLDNYTDYNTKENNHLLMGVVAKLQYPWAQNMLQAMLNVDPNSRPKFKDLLAYINNVYTRTFSQT